MNNVQTFIAAIIMEVLCINGVYAQTNVAKETKVLEQQLNAFSAANKKSAGTENFEFDGCQCKYSYKNDTDKGGFNMTRSNSFGLNEVASVQYARNEDNSYELRIKLKTENNSVTQMFDLSSINVNLQTSDEKQVKEIASRFKNAVKSCSGK
jgi:hypothetical protein